MELSEELSEKLEHKRRGHLTFFYGWVGVAILIALLLLYMSDVATIFRGPLLGIIILCLGVVLTWTFYILQKNFQRTNKAQFMTSLAKSLDLLYSPSHAFEINKVLHHGIIPDFDFCRTEDGFTTNFRSPFPMEFQEIRLSRKEFEEHTHTTRVLQFFKGVVIRVHLTQKLDHQTILLPNRRFRPTTDVGNLPPKRGLEPVNIVSPKFAKAYKLYSSNQVASRTVFDPAFIERFLELSEHLGAEWMEASFKDKELLIVLHFKKDLFEIGGLLKPVTPNTISEALDEVRHILGISDILKHNMYLGPKTYRKFT